MKNYPNGVRYSQIIQYLREEFPNFPKGTIVGAFRSIFLGDNILEKIDRGLFRLKDINVKEHKIKIQ